MQKPTKLSFLRDRIRVVIAERVSTDPDACDRLRNRLADQEPIDVTLPVALADEESAQPLPRPRLR